MTTIRKLFIANRAEIALRIVRTARRMGIATVVPRHSQDQFGPALAEADETVEVFGTPAVSAWLDIPGMIRAAMDTGCDAIHPGYGFLSENAAFAKAVAQAGLTFVGPPATVIELMGDKITARRFAITQGMPVTPSADEAEDPATFAQRARAVGFPLLVKGAAGGGGKGMQIARREEELAHAISVARAESQRYFGDGRLFAERFVEQPRHIEVQVFGDTHGQVIHLGERECSIQRRFQKLIEESPAPALPDGLRDRICDAAVKLAAAAGYVNAGTVECIVSPDGEFFFLEMNTRLQVEHPVTEMVTGLDLVELQLRVAQGEPLPIRQADVLFSGHAIECRILAEDADAGFVPDTGKVLLLHAPTGPGVRFDCGVAEGAPVTADFDSMLAKLVVHGADRTLAISRMRSALAETAMLGVTINNDFLSRVLHHSAFARGETDTGFLERHKADLAPATLTGAERQALLAVAASAAPDISTTRVPEPYASMGAWRN
ncbi:MAG TPA: biotin carboxylase N-terminal domain-containing protein [Polaromonas sp.]|jgi:propionyl-CoA carboxylase alpha chain/3-methylcrotonyl-CoA carboxylase alpha subunit/acetyl-CoA/propionyl-CoA carboxylase biotin carboxyl carrier protein